MSRKYKFRDNGKIYFISFAVVHWIDVFIRDIYKYELIDSWKHCQQHKGLEIYAWCIMTSHVHLLISSNKDKLENIIRDMKSYTSTKLKNAIKENIQESRKEWILWMMERAGKKNSNNNDWQLWQQHNQPIEIRDNTMFEQKLAYIHNNPVEAGFVSEAHHWLFSSAADYSGMQGLITLVQ